MPRDKREFLTFPIDFDEHPIVAPLSDAAFRAFIEMNGYSRRLKLDGRIPEAVARKRWKSKTLAELVASHPDRPLVFLDVDSYVIRSYSEHQFTTADAEELRAKRAAAGAKGGKQKASNLLANAEPFAKQNQAESRVKSQELRTIDISNVNKSIHVVDARAKRIDSDLAQTALEIGVVDITQVQYWFSGPLGFELSPAQAVELSRFVLLRAVGEVRNPMGYLRRTAEGDAVALRALAVEIDLRGVAA